VCVSDVRQFRDLLCGERGGLRGGSGGKGILSKQGLYSLPEYKMLYEEEKKRNKETRAHIQTELPFSVDLPYTVSQSHARPAIAIQK
jgi:hypothetical protein